MSSRASLPAKLCRGPSSIVKVAKLCTRDDRSIVLGQPLIYADIFPSYPPRFFCILWNKIEHVFVAIVDDIFARAIETRHEVGLSLVVQQSGIPYALML